MALTLETRHVGSVYIIQCTGRIVFGEDERALDAAINHAERGFSRIVLDMSAVTRLDSMGLGLLVRQNSNLARRGGGIHLAAAPSFVTALLDLTKVSATIRSFATEDEAILAFHDGTHPQKSEARGSRAHMLIFDPSADLCTFARTVLSQRGFSVRTSCSYGDARLLLRVDPVDYILIGPCSAQITPETAARGFAAIAPAASIFQLGPNFKSHDALQATEILLEMFNIGDQPQPPA